MDNSPSTTIHITARNQLDVVDALLYMYYFFIILFIFYRATPLCFICYIISNCIILYFALFLLVLLFLLHYT